MSLRRGLQVVVGAIRRRIQQQGQNQLHLRKNPDGAPSKVSEQTLVTRGSLAGDIARSWLGRNTSLLHRNQYHPNLASSASRVMRQWRLPPMRFGVPQANGSSSARASSPRSPLLSFLLGFAGVGFVTQESKQDGRWGIGEDEVDCDGNQHSFAHIDLETAIHNIQSVVKAHDCQPKEREEEGDFPPTLDAYAVAEDFLAKGTEGVVYAAKKKDTVSPSPSEEEGEGDAISCHGDSPSHGDGEGFKNHDLEICDDKECTLAIKMMFNYSVGSTAADILMEFHAEQLPLLLAKGQFGKTSATTYSSKCSLRTRHPNIIDMTQAFVSNVTVPNIDQAVAQFDMALPARLNRFGEGADTTLYIVMKRYKTSLRHYLEDHQSLSDRSAMLVVAQLLEAVAYLGDHGIVHRDLKTNNIPVDGVEHDGAVQVVIADFGCALSLGERNLTESVSDLDRNHLGNCALQAPEVKKAFMHNRICYRDYLKADVWAIGAIAYEVCGQDNPFYTHGGLQSDTYSEQNLPQLENQAVGLKFVVQLLLQTDPQERPNAHVVANVLHLFLWQPSIGGLIRLCLGHSSKEKELVAWLIKASLTYLLLGNAAAAVGLVWSRVERDLLGMFLKRVTANDVKIAASYCVGMLRNTVLTHSDALRCATSDLSDLTTCLHNAQPSIICQG